MNHGEQRIWLIRYLLNEDQRLKNYQIPKGEQEQKDLFLQRKAPAEYFHLLSTSIPELR